MFFNWFTSTGVHNRSSIAFNSTDSRALSLGLKFIPTPKPLTTAQLHAGIATYVRRIKLRALFKDQARDDFNTRFWMPNSTYTPSNNDLAAKLSEEALHAVLSTTRNARDITPTFCARVRSNTPHGTLQRLFRIARDPATVIKPADKNLGLTIVDTAWYITECARHLDDTNTYRRIEKVNIPILTIVNTVKKLCTTAANDVTGQMRQFILANVNNYRVPCFYLLIKLHKPTLQGRPIISSVGWVLHHLSKVLDFWLQPFLRRTESYLKDSLTVLRDLEDRRFGSDITMATLDVVSLYPSIPLEEGIKTVLDFISTDIIFHDLAIPSALEPALRLVLQHNYVEFDGKYYHQVTGTAMGTPVAVCFASLFVAAREAELFDRWRIDQRPLPTYYRRFIDDIIIIWDRHDGVQEFLEDVQHLHPALKMETSVSNDSVHFMDLEFLHTGGGQLHTRLYHKPFNLFLFIPWRSYHPTTAKRAFITGLLKSLIRACSRLEDFLRLRRRLWYRLRARGYPVAFLQPLFSSLPYSRTARQALLQPSARTSRRIPSAPLVLSLPAAPGAPLDRIRSFLTLTRSNLRASGAIADTRHLLSLSTSKNLKALLVRSRYISSSPPTTA